MNDLLLPPKTSSTAAPSLPAGFDSSQPRLVIGAHEIAPKDQLLLRSLVRLLNGSEGRRLQFGEAIADCNLVFIGAASTLRPPRGLTVRVVDDGPPPDDAATPPGLSISPPLRMTNVVAVLRVAGQLLSQRATAVESGLLALFQQLSHHLLERERRVTVLPLHDGRLLTINFASERLHATMPLHELLAGAYRIGEPRRASIAEHALFQAGSTLRLRDLLWLAAQRLGESEAAAPPLPGSYKMLRWPDAAALGCPGVPRLAALLTSRAMSLPQARAESGLSAEAIGWLLHAGLALGVVALADAQREAPKVVVAATATRSLISRLRERLKLW